MVIVILIFITLISAGCEVEPDDSLRHPEQFARVYVDLLVAAAGDTLAPAQADSILNAHGYERRQFEAAVEYFSARAERWEPVINEVVNLLEAEVAAESTATFHDSLEVKK